MSSGFDRKGANVPSKTNDGLTGEKAEIVAGFKTYTKQVPLEPHEVFSPPSPQQMGYTGDTCSNCQGVRMRRNGSCMVCDDCGTTTGCS